MNVKQYWDESISFETYLKEVEQTIQTPKTDEEKEKQPFYELAMQRMQRVLKTFKVDEATAEALAAKDFKGKILVISEGWCGDASQIVPVVAQLFEGKNEVQIFYRDKDTALIDAFLTNGSRSIPKVLILNEDYEVVQDWGPRPQHGLALFQKFKDNPEAYPKEQFYNDIQVYYAKNKGKDIVAELLNLL
ncbi:thioredoxin family protein [Riemerella columbina]|uniref:thioredoxin family protein n=1 Tax=Riemerella columbina TaxID=103810 RepID=UPI0003696500|nr:thioredoxin family protein [Riemerella columbina]